MLSLKLQVKGCQVKRKDKVVSCRIDNDLAEKIRTVQEWDYLQTKSDTIKLLLRLGYETWWNQKLETYGIKK